ncbi:outer membrane lipoprotein-sorting protein [Vibrio sp. Of7-15]|uniref:outer membrane lipoprotein-sorting protein n=1 Tax=Vibrio sp. Of7-15 TaxID=2724879 RepID=UPI001EF3A393|nr:outer membrane lipoprotein-sorting protein [Vibrio sp. Of7-15]MCG7495630.1 outer membrane lipoprotein-sorting protein [Vibrio sp. Of7-15]
MFAIIPCFAIASTFANAKTAQEHLQQADNYRYKTGSNKSVTLVKQLEGEELKKSSLYNVYSKTGVGSLVVFQSTAEKGQKMLMQEDKYWMFMPRSKRPIRITPMQKLLGEASVGDISSLSWAESYDVTWINDNPAENTDETVQLELTAKVSGLSYHKIALELDKTDSFPVKADLFLKSGKLTKTAFFTKGQINGEVAVTEMKLHDGIQAKQQTIIEYQSIKELDIPNKLFNPSYLVRNNLNDY